MVLNESLESFIHNTIYKAWKLPLVSENMDNKPLIKRDLFTPPFKDIR